MSRIDKPLLRPLRFYLRRCDVSNRRKADIADRVLGQDSWADNRQGPKPPQRPESVLNQYPDSRRRPLSWRQVGNTLTTEESIESVKNLPLLRLRAFTERQSFVRFKIRPDMIAEFVKDGA
jgi:hypothetical protein